MSEPAEISPLFPTKEREFPQERARRTFEALLEAAVAAFAAKGFDATQTPEIATRAGVSVGTFYRYFSDKMEIFLEVMGREILRTHTSVMAQLVPERFVGQDKRHAIETAIGILFESVNRDLQRVFMEMSMRDERVAELKRASDDDARNRLAELIATICPPDRVPDPQATAFIIQTAVVECAIAIVVRGPGAISRERSLAALTEIVYRAVFSDGE